MPTRHWILLAAIVAGGLYLRLVNIEHWPLWGDEALTFVIASYPARYHLFGAVDASPALYYLLQKANVPDVFAARIPSVVFGTATILATYLFARASRAPGLLAAVLSAVSYPLIDYSQEARAYSLLILLVTSAALALANWTHTKRTRWLYLFSICNVLALYTHATALFWVLPSWIAAFLLNRRSDATLFALATQVAFCSLELRRIAAFPSEGFAWLQSPDLITGLSTLGLVYLPLAIDEEHVANPLTATVTGILLALLFWRAWAHQGKLRTAASASPGATVALAILLAMPFALFVVSQFKPLFMPRTILYTVPAFMVLVALLLSFERRIVSVAVLGLYLASLTVTGTVRDKPDWRAVAARLQAEVRPGDAILVCPDWQAPALRAAMTQSVPAPLYGWRPRAPVLREEVLASSPDWPKVYLRTLYRRLDTPPIQAKRLWKVNCKN